MDDEPIRGTQTLARGLAVIAAVADGAHDLRGVTERVDVGRSTAHRLVQLLVREGYLRAGRDGYSLGPRLIELGFQALHGNPLPVVARPVLEELSEQLRDTVHLAVRDGDSTLYLDKLPGVRGAEMRSRIGHRMPLTRTGVGMALILDDAERWRDLYQAARRRGSGRWRALNRLSEEVLRAWKIWQRPTLPRLKTKYHWR